jgi:hypothetical protein
VVDLVENGELDDQHREQGLKIAWDLLGSLKHELNT